MVKTVKKFTSSKRISIWGSTGSIGKQTLDVINRFPDQFELAVLTTHSNTELLLEQAKRFHPKVAVITGPVSRDDLDEVFQRSGTLLRLGKEGLLEMAGTGEEDLIINALVGSVGLEATLAAIDAGVSIALANKEVLVMAGELVMKAIRIAGLSIVPVDSEHSAIFQCLQGERKEDIRRIVLTASGGPFLNLEKSKLSSVTVEHALAHPNWSMGKKVTIDSATMMNKGLEVIEARWLFDMEPEFISVVIHPQSIIHSMVEFVDGSVKSQMGIPDMRIPISYALTFPERWAGNYGRLDFSVQNELTFFEPDHEKYPALDLAFESLRMGGTAPAVLNAADEVAVDLFLSGKIGFTQIPKLVEYMLKRHKPISNPDLEAVLSADRWTRDVLFKDRINKT